MSEPGYDKVRFIGYAIPTTPAQLVAIGDPDGSGMVAGTYPASADFDADIRARAAVLKTDVDTAKHALAGHDDPTVLNVFVAPEFFWHGRMGPYVHTPTDADPADAILEVLREALPALEYPGFLFVLGTVVTAAVADIDEVLAGSSTVARNDVVRALGEAWLASAGPITDVVMDSLVNFIKNGHAYPAVEVRNRALVISSAAVQIGNGEPVTVLTTEKYFDSNEDFLLWDVTGRPIITEQMTAYPVIDPSGGDVKSTAFDPYSVFRLPNTAEPVHIAIEICLDHADHRLRKSLPRNRWSSPDHGIDLHVIPSCGMQLHPPAVAARAGGWAFNCDGEYPLGTVADAGTGQHGVVAGVDCAFADYVDSANPGYGAHTQLAFITAGAAKSDPQAPGAVNAHFAVAPDVTVVVIPVTVVADLGSHFAGGPGAIHIYGRETPLAIRG
ncbi:hypothetical protein [Microbacterium pumilum]|uniref:CN hydrolase domain-containing protein n=1 Tax=Microbacterium pumilum TaxID=344165 RepID=A0ABN2SBN2_9MICO